jgi:hypothetical protein
MKFFVDRRAGLIYAIGKHPHVIVTDLYVTTRDFEAVGLARQGDGKRTGAEFAE